jgi:hypothetical protein
VRGRLAVDLDRVADFVGGGQRRNCERRADQRVVVLDTKAQQTDRAAWAQAYLSVDLAEFPAIWQVRTLLPEVSDNDIFENLLGLVMTGLLQSAPHPCDCHRPAGS